MWQKQVFWYLHVNAPSFFSQRNIFFSAQPQSIRGGFIRIAKKAQERIGIEDYQHLRKLERWGRICTALGYATAWIIPNPLSAFLISLGNFNRWANIAHPVSHGGYDGIKGIPAHYASNHFAQGWRRAIDWLDWITPTGWHEEHNRAHHLALGEERDPDQVEHNLAWLRDSKLPMWLRYVVVALFACVWKPIYYAQSTLIELRVQNAKKRGEAAEVTTALSMRAWSPLHKEGRQYWGWSILPYAATRFVIIPALFLPLGITAALNVLLTSLMAEVLTNLHAFLVIVPNHTGDDIYRFREPMKNQQEFYYRQVVGSVNYRTGSDLNDFFHGWLNYQIEYHLWPSLPLSQYQQLQPEVKALCEKHGIAYRQESVFKRLIKAVDVMVGKTSMRWDDGGGQFRLEGQHQPLPGVQVNRMA